ncbi:MAG: GGDEF domain-containing protein [Nitrospirae bacterium]|nr:GGDEF domain-containing protein [Nitrospirota bacterium]
MFQLVRGDLIGKNSNDIAPLKILSGSIKKCISEKIEKSEQMTFGDYTLNTTIIPVISNDVPFAIIVFRDISAFVELEKTHRKRNRELAIINTLSGTFISSGDIISVFSDLLEKVLVISDLSIGWIIMKDEKGFILKSILGASTGFVHELENRKLDSIYEDVVGLTDPLYVFEPNEIEKIDILKKEGIVFIVAIPLRFGSETKGILMLASGVEVKFDFDMAALFSLMGNNISLIVEKVMLFQETQRLALTDSLTGLYNVRHFYDILNKEIARARRYNALFSLILFDIDDFKVINDTYGHQAGDEVLRSVASILKCISRETDIVVRYGGEEFILMLPNTSKQETFNLANRIKEKIEDHKYLEKEAVNITISGGIATFPEDAGDSKALLYAADMAMYKAKAMGKKRICFYGENG